MADIPLNIRIKTILESDNALKEMNKQFKDLKSEMIKVEGTLGTSSKEFKRLEADMNSMLDTKKKLQRSWTDTSDRITRTTRDVTVIGLGLNQLADNFQNLGKVLNDSKSSFADVSVAIFKVGTSVATLLPALESLGRALPSAFTAALPVIGTTTAYIVLQVAQIGALVQIVRMASKGYEEFKQILDGGNWVDIANKHIEWMTFGLNKQSDAVNALADNFSWLKYQVDQFREAEAKLNINSKTLGKDIEEKYKKSNAYLEENVKKLKEGTATQEEATNVLNTLYELSKKTTGEELKTLNSQIRFTETYIKNLKELGDEKKRQKPSSNRDENIKQDIDNITTESEKLQKTLDDEEKILSRIVELGGKYTLEWSKSLEKIIKIKEELKLLKFPIGIEGLKNLTPKTVENPSNETPGITTLKDRGMEIQDGELVKTEKVETKFEDLFGNLSDIANNTLIQTLLGGADNFVAKLIDGFGQVMSLASSLIQLIMGITNIASGGIFSFLGFAEGGYTGQGGTLEPAGVVHKGEFVVPANITKQFGVGNLYDFFGLNKSSNSWYKGYNSGGFVNNNSMSPTINVVVESEVERTKAVRFYQNTFSNYQTRQNKKSV